MAVVLAAPAPAVALMAAAVSSPPRSPFLPYWRRCDFDRIFVWIAAAAAPDKPFDIRGALEI